MMSLLVFAASVALLSGAGAKLVWNPITTSVGIQRHQTRTSTLVSIDGNTYPTQYRVLQRGGDVAGGVTFGAHVNENGAVIASQSTSSTQAQSSDYVSMLNFNTSNSEGNILFMMTHFESPAPASVYVSKVIQSTVDGSLKVVWNRPLDFSAYRGVAAPCAGSVTPWETHLGSEESDPNARNLLPATLAATWRTSNTIKSMLVYQGLDPNTATNEDVIANYKPYQYGRVWEAIVDPVTELTSVVKHYSMGRHQMEMAYVAPDRKTVYINIDGGYRPAVMYVADTAGDLSAGCLYAAKVTQLTNTNGGTFTMEWLPMGCATDAELAPFAESAIFTDIFEAMDPAPAPARCVEGFKFVMTGAGSSAGECLKLKNAKLAAFFETTRYAAFIGASTDWNKWEGMTWDASRNRFYFAITSVTLAMLDNDNGSQNDIKLPQNLCGCVYYMDVNPPDVAAPAKPYWGTYIGALFCGEPNANFISQSGIVAGSNSADDLNLNKNNFCNVDKLASPDNLAYAPGHDGLFVTEDTSGHQNDLLWYYDLQTLTLTRVFSTPFGSEVTGSSWFSNVNGWTYLVVAIQAPYGSSLSQSTQVGFSGVACWVGYIGVSLPAHGLVSGLPNFGEVCGPVGDNAACDDGNAATKDVCQAGSYYDYPSRCANVAGQCTMDSHCDDGNACTTDSCVGNSCVNAVEASCKPCSSASNCDDDNRCTVDTCVAGKCQYQNMEGLMAGCKSCAVNADCNDGNSCTRDVCLFSKCYSSFIRGCACNVASDCTVKKCLTARCVANDCLYSVRRPCPA